jgi:hypothetical protein
MYLHSAYVEHVHCQQNPFTLLALLFVSNEVTSFGWKLRQSTLKKNLILIDGPGDQC